jgi:polysaccharide pyruvyl transferase WcaK-like protein
MTIDRSKLNKRILFCGYYGRKNTGDDVFCAVASWGANKYWSCNDINFYARDLPALPVPSKTAMTGTRFFKGQNQIELVGNLLLRPTIVYAGGSLFYRRMERMSPGEIIKKGCKVLGLSVGAIGVSLGPYACEKDRMSVRELLCGFSFLALRDKCSYEDACDMDLPFKAIDSFDLAGLFPNIYGDNRALHTERNSSKIIGISVCPHESITGGDIRKEKKRLDAIIEALMILHDEVKVTLRLIVINGEDIYGDVLSTKYLLEKLDSTYDIEIIPYYPDPKVMWQYIESCDLMLSTRMHGGVMAYFSNTPFLMVEYHRKCTDFLDGIGIQNKYRIGDMEKSPRQVASLILNLLANNEMPACMKDKQLFIDKAKRNFLL